jgi:Phytanoyl-CoA hydroxylase-interacting protein C-terminus
MYSVDLTASDLAILYERALKYTLSNELFVPITPCNWFYRNKSNHYFDEIMFRRRGIMEVYIKDGSGDRASPINGAINGLFFMAKNESGFPPRESAFGPTRLQVPPSVLLRQAPNMYFADFFCMHGKTHVVTVVLTTPYSEVDKFCHYHLLPLDINKNPFLFRRGPGLYTAQGW